MQVSEATDLLEIPLVGQPVAGRFQGKGKGVAEDDGFICGLGGDLRLISDRDGDGIRPNGIAVFIPDFAVKLNAVPCGIWGAGFGCMGVSVPRGEGVLPLLFEIPLVGQPVAGRFQGKGKGVAEDDGFICGLGGDGRLISDRDGDGIRPNGIAVAVLDEAIKLNTVPCGVRGTGFRSTCVSVPYRKRGRAGFLEIPLIGQSVARRFERQGDRVAKINGFVGGLLGNGKFWIHIQKSGVRLKRLPAAVFDNAVESAFVPRHIRRKSFTCVGSATPLRKR